jgi:hypothetical protein
LQHQRNGTARQTVDAHTTATVSNALNADGVFACHTGRMFLAAILGSLQQPSILNSVWWHAAGGRDRVCPSWQIPDDILRLIPARAQKALGAQVTASEPLSLISTRCIPHSANGPQALGSPAIPQPATVAGQPQTLRNSGIPLPAHCPNWTQLTGLSVLMQAGKPPSSSQTGSLSPLNGRQACIESVLCSR